MDSIIVVGYFRVTGIKLPKAVIHIQQELDTLNMFN